VSGRRPIRVICTPPPTSRRVPYTCGQTVVAVSEDTGYTIRLEYANEPSAAARNSSLAVRRLPCAGQTIISPRRSTYSAG
jgi:hypothetical protein